MKHPSIRDLLEYWNERRGRRAAPERDDIEPEAIRGLLADTFILSIDPFRGHPFRLAGTRVCALLGREIKGQAFLDLFTAATRSEIRELFAIIANEAVGVAGGASELMAEGPEATRLELLLLPLGHYGRTDTRLLGALAASEPPNWLGTRALRHLELGTYRFVGRTAVPACDHAQRNIPAAKVQSRFTVYEGRQRPSSGPPAT
jgi:hypothetical protein